jgi:hypothetical protein
MTIFFISAATKDIYFLQRGSTMGNRIVVHGLNGSIAVSEDFITSEINKEAYFIHLHGTNPGEPHKDWEEAERLVKNHFRYLADRG